MLGTVFEVNNKSCLIKISQTALIKKTVSEHAPEQLQPSSIPMSALCRLSKTPTSATEEEKSTYQSLIGSLLYLSRISRPDISASVNFCSRFCSNPAPEHFEAAKKILGYLKRTKNSQLLFKSSGLLDITAYCDADWAGDPVTRASTYGFAIFLGRNLIAWCSRAQKSIALSTMEAEYVAIAEATKEILFIQQLLVEIGIASTQTRLFCDNRAAIEIATNPKDH